MCFQKQRSRQRRLARQGLQATASAVSAARLAVFVPHQIAESRRPLLAIQDSPAFAYQLAICVARDIPTPWRDDYLYTVSRPGILDNIIPDESWRHSDYGRAAENLCEEFNLSLGFQCNLSSVQGFGGQLRCIDPTALKRGRQRLCLG